MQPSRPLPGRNSAPAGHPGSRTTSGEPSVLGALAAAAAVAVLLGLVGLPLWILGLVFGAVVCVVMIVAGGSTGR